MIILSIRKKMPLAMALFVSWIFLCNDLGVSVFLGYLPLFICLVLEIIEVFATTSIKIKSELLPTLMMLVCIMLSCLNNIDLHDSTKNFYLIIAVTSFLGISFSKYDSNISNKITSVFIFAGCLFSTVIYLHYFFPNTFMNKVFVHFSNESQVYSKRLIALGYCISLGGSISYTLLIIVNALFFLLFTNKKINFKPIIALYLIISLVISQRRTELFAFLITSFILIGFVKKDLMIKFIKKYCFLLFPVFIVSLVIIVYGVIYIQSLPYNYNSDNRFIATIIKLKQHEDISNGRDRLYRIAIELFFKNKFIGIGFMNFSKHIGETGLLIARNVHNIYIQLFTECGIFFGGQIIILMFVNVYISIKKVINRNKPMIGTAILLYICIAGLTDNTMFYPYTWIYYMIAIYEAGFTDECSIDTKERIRLFFKSY